jgi:Tfp pilus assembly protein PilZ
MTTEKRKYLRFDVFFDAFCRKRDKRRLIKVKDFSREGAGISAEGFFKEGEDVEIEMNIPGDNIPIVIQGQIAWCAKDTAENFSRSGIKFSGISDNDRSRVLEHIYRNWAGSEKNNGNSQTEVQDRE